jgi:hypothetical protein
MVLFNQLLWSVLVGGITGTVVRWPRRRAVRIVGGLAVGAVLATLIAAWPSVRARVDVIQTGRRGLTLGDLRDLRAVERRVMPPEESYLVTSRANVTNQERWIGVEDDSVDLYVHSARPTVFLYFQSRGSAFTASDLERVCADLKSGARWPMPIATSKARWVAIKTRRGEEADWELHSKMFCDVPLVDLFPRYAAAGAEGAITLYRLW